MCPLLIGVHNCDVNMVKLCLMCPQTKVDTANKEGKSALILAMERENVEILKLLLSEDFIERFDIDHQDVSCLCVFAHQISVTYANE